MTIIFQTQGPSSLLSLPCSLQIFMTVVDHEFPQNGALPRPLPSLHIPSPPTFPPTQIFMTVVDHEFPQPGAADQFLDGLKQKVVEAAEHLKLQPTPDLVSRALQAHAMLQV